MRVFCSQPLIARSAVRHSPLLPPKLDEPAGPHGGPSWITRELLDRTMSAWQPYYSDRLTEDDALEILLNTGLLIDRLRSFDAENLPSAGEGIEPRAGA